MAKASVGRHAPKVKSACRTCKLRKVKCDEAKPACKRCIKAGRTCEGYGIWGGGNAKDRSLVSSSTSISIASSGSQPGQRTLQPSVEHATKGSFRSIAQFEEDLPDSLNLTLGEDDQFGSEDWSMVNPELFLWEEQLELINQPIPRLLLNLPNGLQERTLLSWYFDVCSWKLPGTFSSEFWKTLLPQACHSEPAVLYGVLALASAHRSESLQPHPQQALQDEQRTLRFYTKAIHHLQTHLTSKITNSARIAIMTCILFVSLEIVQRRYAVAASHLSSGLKLIRQYPMAQLKRGDCAMEVIEQSMLKLSLQVNQMGHEITPPLIRRLQSPTKIPTYFNSVEHAREHLDKIEGRILEMYKLIGRYGVQEEQAFDLDDQRETIREDLRLWLKAYAASCIETDLALPQRTKAATIVLRMYYQTAVIYTEVCQEPRLEAHYDEHTSRFLCIANDATKMWNAVRSSHEKQGPQFPGDIQASIIDIGWIPATYFLALKCRIREIRLRAINLLERTYHTEGMWNALMCARVAREIMKMENGPDHEDEEEDLFLDIPLRPEDLSQPTIPEQNRLYDVELIHPSTSLGKLKLKCRRRNEGLRQYTEREFDPLTGQWEPAVWQTVNPGCPLHTSGHSMVLRPESWIALE